MKFFFNIVYSSTTQCSKNVQDIEDKKNIIYAVLTDPKIIKLYYIQDRYSSVIYQCGDYNNMFEKMLKIKDKNIAFQRNIKNIIDETAAIEYKDEAFTHIMNIYHYNDKN